MLSSKEVVIVYETLLSSPGMLDTMKIQMQLSRKIVLLLAKVIEVGLLVKADPNTPSILQVLNEADVVDIQQVVAELLSKGGLTSMNEKLLGLQTK